MSANKDIQNMSIGELRSAIEYGMTSIADYSETPEPWVYDRLIALQAELISRLEDNIKIVAGWMHNQNIGKEV